jgi:hypothetical protein
MSAIGDEMQQASELPEQATSGQHLPSNAAGPDALLQAFASDANRNEGKAIRFCQRSIIYSVSDGYA